MIQKTMIMKSRCKVDRILMFTWCWFIRGETAIDDPCRNSDGRKKNGMGWLHFILKKRVVFTLLLICLAAEDSHSHFYIFHVCFQRHNQLNIVILQNKNVSTATTQHQQTTMHNLSSGKNLFWFFSLRLGEISAQIGQDSLLNEKKLYNL